MRTSIVKMTMVVLLLGAGFLQAQDFLLRGCYGSCQDSAKMNAWMKTLRAQAPDLAYRGFTYIWLPKAKTEERAEFADVVQFLRKTGIQPMMDLNIPNGGAIFQLMPLSEQLRNDFQIKSFRIVSEETPKPVIVANFLNEYYKQNPDPALVYADIPTLQQPEQFARWVKDVIENLPEETRQNILPRVYDYPLREALRRACTDPTFDVRAIYNNSLRDSTGLIGYNIITGVNKAQFYNADGKPNTADDLIQNPLLAYAYILANNQIGLPEIFYADYFGKESGNQYYINKPALKKEIDQLLKAHQEYIFNSTDIEYLNRIGTDKKSVYRTTDKSADAKRVLLFQMDGTNTPAGQANKKPRDVLVAINFADAPLKVYQELNGSNVQLEDVFTDVLGRSAESSTKVQDYPDLDIQHAVYLELPPRSYSVWVQGEAAPLTPGFVNLAADAVENYVELTWEASVESEISNYEIEKSINGSAFHMIALVKPLHDPGATYLYTDEEHLPNEAVTYRVKTIYKDGTSAYSNMQELQPKVKGVSFELLDHVKSGIKTVKIKSDQQSEGKVTIFSADGKPVLLFTQPIKKGISLAQINLTSLPKGIYLLNISTKDKDWTKKIINQ